jgi:hypothetical protein
VEPAPADLGLGGNDLLAGMDLVGSLLAGGRALPNLMPSKGPAMAPVATVLTDDAEDEGPSPDNGPDEEPAPWMNFVVGLDDTIHRPPHLPLAPRPGSRQGSDSLGEQFTALDRPFRALDPPLLAAADPPARLPGAGPHHSAAPPRAPALQVSGDVLAGLLVALACGILYRTSVSDPAPADRGAERPSVPIHRC